MENLIQIVNNQAVVSSRKVADSFRKEHSKVLRSIKNVIELTQAQNGFSELTRNDEIKKWFYETTYIDNRRKIKKCLTINVDKYYYIDVDINRR
nr:MAG TPA: regulatory protein [Caudoviricetes sp.]